jgi:hypothetical protein
MFSPGSKFSVVADALTAKASKMSVHCADMMSATCKLAGARNREERVIISCVGTADCQYIAQKMECNIRIMIEHLYNPSSAAQ